MLNIQFLVNIDSTLYSSIVLQLKSLGLNVNSLWIWDFGNNAPLPTQISCSKNYSDWPQVVNQQSVMHNINGINKTTISSYEVIKEKQIWYRHWVFPMIIGAIINGVSILLAIFTVKPSATLMDYLIISIIPTILGFGSTVIARAKTQ
jgi:hypothetical protein